MKWFALLSLLLLASITFVEVDSEDIDEEDSDGDGVPDEEDEDDDNDGIPDDGKVYKEGFCRSFFICKLLLCLRSYYLFLFCCNPSCFALQRQINISPHHLDDDDDDDDDIADVDEDEEDEGAEEDDSGGGQIVAHCTVCRLQNSILTK